MKKFESPEITIIKFIFEDILTSSGRDDEVEGEWGQRTFELPLI